MPAAADMTHVSAKPRHIQWKLSLIAMALVSVAGWKLYADRSQWLDIYRTHITREPEPFDWSRVKVPKSEMFFGGPSNDGILVLAESKLKDAKEASQEFQPRRVLPPLPPIKDFPVVSAQQVAGRLAETELVLGVTIDGQSRAYPINMLTGPRREILNDTVAGHAIAATW